MESKDRGFVVDYVYTLENGEKRKRSELIDMVRSSIKNGKQTTSSISKDIKLEMSSLQNILRYMQDKHMIVTGKGNMQGGGFTYFIKDECLLSSLFLPSAADIEKSFKIKSRTVRKVEDGTSKTSGRGGVTKFYSGHIDSVYWG